MQVIRGAGGGKSGGGSGRVPVESPDSLRSRQYARVLDLITEGECGGLVNGLKSVYLDDTPIMNADGSLNFQGATLVTRTGTQSQSYIPGFGAVEAETAVSVEVTKDAPVVRSVSNANANAIRITVSVPQLKLQNSTNGDTGGTAVDLAIDVQTAGGGYVPCAIGSSYSADGVTVVNGIAKNSVASNRFMTAVEWVNTAEYLRPTCTFDLLYRLAGSGPWSVVESFTFAPEVLSAVSFAMALAGLAAQRKKSKDFYAELPHGEYEFKAVKTGGSSIDALTGGLITGVDQGGGVVISVLLAEQRKYKDTISGKTTSKYQRSYQVDLTGMGPWDIRVRRLTEDSGSSMLVNATYWDSYTEIIDAKLRYPNSALVALSIDSERFSAIPKRGYEMLGLHVRIPSNYSPATRAYAGVWDGTFTTAWTNNPAWCFYDLLTSERYGLGAFIAAGQVDKWALYEIAQHCDELVPDGFGNMEPRFTCNLYLQTREEAYRVITNFASIFCGMAFWGAGSIMTVQDAPADPVKLFTNANVTLSNGVYFNYSGSSIKARHTVALVSWNDPEDRYKQKIEYIEDAEGILKYGIIQTEVVALGCTSRGQAHRYGRRILYTERMETEAITFRAGMDGLSIAPGDVIQTSDPVRAGVRMGGRLIAATSSSLTLDAAVTLSPGATYTLWAVLPSGAVESRAVTTGASTTDALTVSPAFTAAPQAMAMWVLAASNLAPETWRVVSIAEADGTQAEISALKYSPNKYAEIEQGVILEALPTSSLSLLQAAPSNIDVSESLYMITPASIGARITVSWQCDAPRYELRHRIAGGNWSIASTSMPSVDIQPVEAGDYEFLLTAINSIGARSQVVSFSSVIYGKTAPPAAFDVFAIMAQPDGTRQYNFGYTTTPKPLDWLGAEIRYVSGTTATPDWATMTPLHDAETYYTNSPVELNAPLAGAYTFACKSLDTTGNESAYVVHSLTLPDRRLGNVFDEFFEGPEGWLGAKSGCQLQDGILQAIDATTWATAPATWDAWTRWNFAPTSPISYVTPVRDFGTVLAGQINSTVDADGTVAQELATSADGVTWSAWSSASAPFAARYLKLRLTVTATGPAPVPVVRAWSYQINAPMRSEYLNDIVTSALTGAYRIGAGDVRIPLAGVYAVLKRTTVVIQDNRAGTWTYTRIDQSLSPAPRWQFRLNGTLTDPQFVDFFIEGY